MEQNHCGKCKSITNLSIIATRTLKSGESKKYYTCRSCNTARLKAYRKTEVGMYNVQQAVYRSTNKHRKKQNARVILYHHIKIGEINKPNICSVCFEVKPIEGHHHDYEKPLDVTWLCKQCHADLHNKLKMV